MWWYFFAFKIYASFDATHPRLTVLLIMLLTVTNCTFGVCVYGEVAAYAYALPPQQCTLLLTLFVGFHQYLTYYFHHVERRATKGEWTVASVAVVSLYWIVTALLFEPRPAAIGCEHALCIFPHPPLAEGGAS